MTLTDQSSSESSVITEEQSNKAPSNVREDQTGSQDAVDELIQKLQLHPAGHPGRADTLHDLALALSERYERSGSPVDLDESIRLYAEAQKLYPNNDPRRGACKRALDRLYRGRRDNNKRDSECIIM